MLQTQQLWRNRPATTVALAIGALVLVRIAALAASSLELGPDESQYWRWAQQFDWGYYSKPPLIAWAIGLTTSIFGDSEWAVRLSAPIAHGFAGFALFALGRRMFNARCGAWAAAIYLLMPGVWLSSTLMSTDALLLPLWSLALYALWRMRETPTVPFGLLAGAAIGLAMLAKYAALYLILGAGLAAVIDRDTRRALLSPAGLAAALAVLAVMSPNILWNAAHDFETVGHTSDNANWSHASIQLGHLMKFVTDQMAVFGPVSLIAGAIGAIATLTGRDEANLSPRRWLLCFILPPLAIIAVQAVVARAHANWAATAYPAAAVLLGSFAAGIPWRRWIAGGLAFNVLLGATYLVMAVYPAAADATGASNAFKRVRGWEAMATELSRIAQQHDASALMFDEREPWHTSDFYGQHIPLPPLRMWRSLDEPQNFAEETGVMAPGDDRAVLFASVVPQWREREAADFASFEPIGSLDIPLGRKKVRHIDLYLARGYAPLPRTGDYFERYPR